MLSPETPEQILGLLSPGQQNKRSCGQADDAAQLKRECEVELSKAMPALEAALSALNTLQPADLEQLAAMEAPPPGAEQPLLTMRVCFKASGQAFLLDL